MRLIQLSDNLLKKLKKFKSDKAVLEGYLRTIDDLKTTPDPTKIGDRKHGIYRNCFAIHVTKNHSILYRYLAAQDIVQIIDLDDHKSLFGRDNRA